MENIACFVFKESYGNDRAFAIYNPTDSTREVTVDLRKILLGGKITLTDAFTGETITPNSYLLTHPLIPIS